MAIDSVTINEVDNQIGVNIAVGDVLALVGCSSSGTVNQPTALTRKQDVITTFDSGPLVEDAVWLLEEGLVNQVLCVKAGVTTVGGYGSVDVTARAGTSVVTGDVATEPYNEFDVVLEFTAGGTIGVAGITLRYSLDDGRTYSQVQALGTAAFYLIAEANVRLNFAAGTFVTGDVVRVRTTAPRWNGAQLASAITALQVTAQRFDIVYVAGPMAAADFDTLATSAAAMKAAGRYKRFAANVRSPTIGETEAAYLASLANAFSAKADSRIMVGAGYARITSPIGRHEYRRPAMLAIIGRLISIPAGTDAARVLEGPLPSSVSILDDYGNPKEHDEQTSPGLDDLRFSTLRTRDGRPGVYVGNARLFSTPGSDYVFGQHGRVMDKAAALAAFKLTNYSSDDVLTSKTNGRILESEAASIDSDVTTALETALVDPQYATAATFTLARDNNLLSTFRLDGSIRVQPKGYIKSFVVDLGLYNPANAVQEGG